MTLHYVGTKIVLAWPAHKEGREGYAVRYEDGYHSWCPKETFEKANVHIGHIGDLPPHIQRMCAEHAQLQDRIEKLSLFLVSNLFVGLSPEEQQLQREQLAAMREYSRILKKRIEISK